MTVAQDGRTTNMRQPINFREGVQVIRSRAPLRISFAGGGTDVAPYPQDRGGCVLSAAIDMYAYASLIPEKSGRLVVESPDLGTVFRMEAGGSRDGRDRSDLVDAVLAEFHEVAGQTDDHRLVLHCDAPPGSGLGSSSAMIVATTAVLSELARETIGPYEIAQRAVRIEREGMEVPGGIQDQYAATFGGFNFMEFEDSGVLVHPLALRPETLNELHASLVLCYTGQTRLGGHILKRQIEGYVTGRDESLAALERIKAIAVEMRAALLRGDLADFAAGIAAGWEEKKRLADGITADELDRLYELGKSKGAVAGKVLGAGGGGYILFYCPVEKTARLRDALESDGRRVVPFSFEKRGVQTWRVRN